MIGIYKIINLKNNKFYIGSSNNLSKRISNHKRSLNKNKHHNVHLQNAFNKYGKDMFVFEIIEQCSIDVLIVREQWFIDNLKPYYNIRKIAENNTGVVRSEEVRLKHSKMMTGRKHSEESKLKMSLSQKGKSKCYSEVYLKNLSNKMKSLKLAKGVKWTDKQKIARGILKSKPVIQYDLKGIFIKEYPRVKDVELLNNFNQDMVTQCCKNKKTSYKGFIWKYKNKENVDLSK